MREVPAVLLVINKKEREKIGLTSNNDKKIKCAVFRYINKIILIVLVRNK